LVGRRGVAADLTVVTWTAMKSAHAAARSSPGCVHSIRNVGEDAVDLVCGLSRPEYGEIGLV
jgi:hypothetical protein